MRLSEHINVGLHKLFAVRLRGAYRREMKWIRRMNPDAFSSVAVGTLDRHLALWGRFDPKLNADWLRLLTKISGQEDYRFVPSTVYYGIVERCLNNCNAAGHGIEDKNLMALYLPANLRAKCVLRYDRGVFFDDEFNVVSPEAADELLKSAEFDLVGKVAAGSSGGHSVELFTGGIGPKRSKRHELTARWISDNALSYVVQEKLIQEPLAASFNSSSINTCRIMTFRRPWDGSVCVAAAMLRLGCSDNIVDNISSGGVSVGVRRTGELNPTGITAKFGIVDKHPSSKRAFGGFVIPGYAKMCDAVCSVAAKVPDFNLLGFDVMLRADGNPCIVEINATSLCAIEVQMSGPLFGDDSERVVEWCLANRKLDSFDHLRTWY